MTPSPSPVLPSDALNDPATLHLFLVMCGIGLLILAIAWISGKGNRR